MTHIDRPALRPSTHQRRAAALAIFVRRYAGKLRSDELALTRAMALDSLPPDDEDGTPNPS